MTNVLFALPRFPLSSPAPSGMSFAVTDRPENRLTRMVSSGMLRRVALVRIDVSEELSPSFIRVTRIGEPGTTRYFFAACVGG
jgi:hypothetical protein